MGGRAGYGDASRSGSKLVQLEGVQVDLAKSPDNQIGNDLAGLLTG